MKVRILENYVVDDDGNMTCNEKIIDNIRCIDFDDNEVFITLNNGESECIELKTTRYVSDITIVMDR